MINENEKMKLLVYDNDKKSICFFGCWVYLGSLGDSDLVVIRRLVEWVDTLQKDISEINNQNESLRAVVYQIQAVIQNEDIDSFM